MTGSVYGLGTSDVDIVKSSDKYTATNKISKEGNRYEMNYLLNGKMIADKKGCEHLRTPCNGMMQSSQTNQESDKIDKKYLAADVGSRQHTP